MRSSILDRIDSEALDGDISKALRLCLSLGGRANSVELREWANKELKGYIGEELPDYRIVRAPLTVDGQTMMHRVTGQTISTFGLPDFAQDKLSDEVELRQSIPGLVALIQRAELSGEPIRMSPPLGQELVTYMNAHGDRSRYIERLYWNISTPVVKEVVEHVRSGLIELVAEIRAGMAPSDADPAPEAVAQAVQVVIQGDRNKPRIVYSSGNVSADSKSRFRRSIEIASGIAAVGALAVTLALNWGRIFGA